MKVGADVAMDQRRLALIRSIIDDPKECGGRPTPSPESLVGKQAGPTGSVLMIDSNQVWEYVASPNIRLARPKRLTYTDACLFSHFCSVQEAVDYVKQLEDARPWFIEEPTAPVSLAQMEKRWPSLTAYSLRTHARMTSSVTLRSGSSSSLTVSVSVRSKSCNLTRGKATADWPLSPSQRLV